MSQAGLSPDNSWEIALKSFETRKKIKNWVEWAADCYEFVRCYEIKCKIRLLLLKFNHFIPEKGVTEHRRVRNAGTYRFWSVLSLRMASRMISVTVSRSGHRHDLLGGDDHRGAPGSAVLPGWFCTETVHEKIISENNQRVHCPKSSAPAFSVKTLRQRTSRRTGRTGGRSHSGESGGPGCRPEIRPDVLA